MIARATYWAALAVGMSWLAACATTARSSDNLVKPPDGIEASGSFTPTGAPPQPPVKIEVGKSCLVDLKQSYSISGTLSGIMMIDYRILVYGPCGVPPGTFDEDWIAHGTFTGTANGSAVSGKLSYVAKVQAGGNVEGRISLGQGLRGELQVRGNFSDGSLAYTGWAR